MKGDNVSVSLRHAFEHGNLVPHLNCGGLRVSVTYGNIGFPFTRGTDHVLAALHELLVDDLAGIVLARLDVHGLLYDGVCSTAERLASAILPNSDENMPKQRHEHLNYSAHTWHGIVAEADMDLCWTLWTEVEMVLAFAAVSAVSSFSGRQLPFVDTLPGNGLSLPLCAVAVVLVDAAAGLPSRCFRRKWCWLGLLPIVPRVLTAVVMVRYKSKNDSVFLVGRCGTLCGQAMHRLGVVNIFIYFFPCANGSLMMMGWMMRLVACSASASCQSESAALENRLSCLLFSSTSTSVNTGVSESLVVQCSGL